MAVSRPGQIGVGVQGYAPFKSKPESGDKGTGPFTRLTTVGINGRRVSFTGKIPGNNKGTGPFTRLAAFGIMGRRVSFVSKALTEDDNLLGGGAETRKPLTKAEIRGLKAIYGPRVMLQPEIAPAISDEVPEVEEPTLEYRQPTFEYIQTTPHPTEKYSILKWYTIPVVPEKKMGIGLILAIMKAHENHNSFI